MSTHESCDVVGCERRIHPLAGPDQGYVRRCALHEIATHNEEELRQWGEGNAADMVAIARAELARRILCTCVRDAECPEHGHAEGEA